MMDGDDPRRPPDDWDNFKPAGSSSFGWVIGLVSALVLFGLAYLAFTYGPVPTQ